MVRPAAQAEDVHIWSLDASASDMVKLAKENTLKHYGDVLSEGNVIETDGGLDGVRRELADRGLSANLELPPSGAVFWAPAGSRYRSKSVPQQ